MSAAPVADASVVAIVVAYCPDPMLFDELLGSLAPQVYKILVVDNGQGVGLDRVTAGDALERHDMRGNAGIAAAQNFGVRRALQLGATHVLMLDHDSVPATDMTARLLHAARQLEASGERVAAVGADYRDPRHAEVSPFVVMSRWGFRRVVPAGAATVPVTFLISAGSLIGRAALLAVGPMEERLFIDYVDIEWCLRGAALGWHCHGVPGARLEHRLGEEVLGWGRDAMPLKIFGRTWPARSPLRHYYLFRNGIWLMLHGMLPLRWKLLEAKRLAAGFIAFGLFATRRGEQLAAMLSGAFDGLRGRMGPAVLRGSSVR